MTDLSKSELRRLDLTLLLVFLGLVRHRKAITVAVELGLTQSAISQALKRLREIFGDDLFLRRPHGMEPTSTALALEVPISGAVEYLRGALGTARAFDPASATGVVRIAALHAEQVVLLPPLVARLRVAAPSLDLAVLPSGRGAALEALNQGEVDLVLGFYRDTPEVFSREVLYEEGYLVAGRPDALPDAPRIDINSFCAADHILASPGGGMRGVVDEQLQALGRTRRVVLGLPAFLPALAAAETMGALVTLPARVALTLATKFDLVTAHPPVALRSFPVSVLWHRRNDADPRTKWIRSQLRPAVDNQAP